MLRVRPKLARNAAIPARLRPELDGAERGDGVRARIRYLAHRVERLALRRAR
jgi:hypothetical protein